MDLEVRMHPTLGIMVRNDGAVLVKDRGSRKDYWFFGYKNAKGYCIVSVKGKYRKVHRLVLETFIGIPDDGMMCDHINRVRNDNRVENLRWVTAQENARNTKRSDACVEKYGVHSYEDSSAYHKAWSINRKGVERCDQA